MSAWGSILPTCRFNPGLNWQWEWRKDGTLLRPLTRSSSLQIHHSAYARFGTETISTVPYLFGDPAIYTCSLEVARQILSTQGEFYKNPRVHRDHHVRHSFLYESDSSREALASGDPTYLLLMETSGRDSGASLRRRSTP